MDDARSPRFEQIDPTDERPFEGYMPATPTILFESSRFERMIEKIFRRRGPLRADRVGRD